MVQELMEKRVIPGVFYPCSLLKEMLQETYTMLGMNETTKASDINNYFNAVKKSRRIYGVVKSGYVIIKQSTMRQLFIALTLLCSLSVMANQPTIKKIENGKVVIIKDGVKYDTSGRVLEILPQSEDNQKDEEVIEEDEKKPEIEDFKDWMRKKNATRVYQFDLRK